MATLLEAFQPIYDKCDALIRKYDETVVALGKAQDRLAEADTLKQAGVKEVPLTDRAGDFRKISVDAELVQAAASIAKREDNVTSYRVDVENVLPDMEAIAAAFAGLLSDARRIVGEK